MMALIEGYVSCYKEMHGKTCIICLSLFFLNYHPHVKIANASLNVPLYNG